MQKDKSQSVLVLEDAPYTLNLVCLTHFFGSDDPDKYQEAFPIQASNDGEAIEKAKQAVEVGGIAAKLSGSVGYVFARHERGKEPRCVCVRYIMYCKFESFDAHTVRSGPIGFFAKDENEARRIFESYPVEHRNVCYAPWGIAANVKG